MPGDPWDRLDRALNRRGRTLFWWRDDDAVAWTPALERLVAALGDIPFALAVIPASAGAGLPGRILQHGWRHTNHAPPGEKRAEFGPHRSAATMIGEIRTGRERLEQLYGPDFLPVFVPPWNRICPVLADALPAEGIAGLSAFRTPGTRFSTGTHIDPVDWRGGRRFRGVGPVLDDAAAQVAAAEGPVGMLSHHLVADAEGLAFLAEFARFVAAHPRAGWADPRDLWPD